MATAVSERKPSSEAFPLPYTDRDQRSPSTSRIDSIDLLRGIVMVVMMLDHTRDFVHNAAFQFDPLDVTRTNVALFFTRWITHYCAPTFVFLAGTGAFLYGRRKTKGELSRFLITRGLWLIVLEFTLVRLGAFFNVSPALLGMLQVIWAIGVSMILLAGLVHLPLKLTLWFGLLMIALHNLLDPIRVAGFQGPNSPAPGIGAKLFIILHQQGAFPIAGFPSPFLLVLYPLIPWVGVMAVGYAFGTLYQLDAFRRRRLLLWIGSGAIALFILLRAVDLYGEPLKWTHQPNPFFTFLSFLNTTKYPPSLLFLLMTLGPSILALYLFESMGTGGAVRNFFVTFGRVPLFFYLLQWPTAHAISLLLHYAFGKPTKWLFQTPIEWFTAPPQGTGFNLLVVYLAWIAGVLLLYPLCKWFAGVKQRRRDWWLSYL
ncbi:MAG TPA: heparan-alpha-glucosaminide N-acetyltransferase domain-containing protein [Pyrinomonadaceae bacterium]|nr:heparan-alpha-glucosaminide N-acetyltransferase domain-containing protein [Pyrinomonadaceae bacterium]